MAKTITPRQLRQHWLDGREIALVDVREEGPYAESHPFFALSVPVSEVQVRLPVLIPRLGAPVVVYDDGEGYVERAAVLTSALGYREVYILEGGLSGYEKVGELFRDVNVPSKAFGELVEAIRKTPFLRAPEVKEVLESDRNVVVLDARRFEEYNTMSIPKGQSCPGGELLYRVFDAAPDPSTTVIVHCAGRTRSIVGTQSLVNAGIPNRVVALENGTIGWTLAGFKLDTGRDLRIRPPSTEALQKAQKHAKEWAEHVGVPVIDGEQLRHFAASVEERTTYFLDVRDPTEYAQGHPAGFVSAPGGQLVQATDEWVGVRGARIVLYDTGGVRGLMTASWLLQLGWDVSVLREDISVPDDLIPARKIKGIPHSSASIDVQALMAASDMTIVDLARSPAYQKGHIPGAWFASGPELVRDLGRVPGAGPIVLTSPDGQVALANVENARQEINRDILYLVGGTAAWIVGEQPMETETRWLSEPIDVYKRPYEGTENAVEAMQGYIDWEHGLVAQLANDGISGFRVVREKSSGSA
ncbi:Rhodanese-like domain-containing protein [Plectosphaerella cucumerina]|uniref:Rhodanese-like domain-containing protein n=1 Tax=Plectosphaerella cucumerina TaxID=40658 RepID=A0A8K0TT95_9PEZI|nr:Rhodanese-like domain-containing protein [Plectosphaerella cucumerina]